MKRFITMEEASCYYEPITKEWKENRDTSSLYHYTSTEVLDKILKNACFWASNIYYLNDSSEFKAGINEIRNSFQKEMKKNNREIVEEYLEEIGKYDAKNWPGIYTISFSTLPDELQQWTTYAKESGVCIELDCKPVLSNDYKEERLLLKQKSVSGRYINASENYNGFASLIYAQDEKEPKKRAKSIFDEFVEKWDQLEERSSTKLMKEKKKVWEERSREAKQYLALRASYNKMKGFNGESEVRISFFPLKELNPITGETETAEIKYSQIKGGILRPYLEIYFFQGTDATPRCQIKSITIGPSGKQQNVYDSVVHRLRYGEVNVWNYSVKERFQGLKEYIQYCIECLPPMEQKNKIITNQITCLIAKEWSEDSEEIDFEVQVKALKRIKSSLVLKGNTIQFINLDTGGKTQKEIDELFQRAEVHVQKYKKDRFYSSHGILVKKSEIPYIF